MLDLPSLLMFGGQHQSQGTSLDSRHRAHDLQTPHGEQNLGVEYPPFPGFGPPISDDKETLRTFFWNQHSQTSHSHCFATWCFRQSTSGLKKRWSIFVGRKSFGRINTSLKHPSESSICQIAKSNSLPLEQRKKKHLLHSILLVGCKGSSQWLVIIPMSSGSISASTTQTTMLFSFLTIRQCHPGRAVRL